MFLLAGWRGGVPWLSPEPHKSNSDPRTVHKTATIRSPLCCAHLNLNKFRSRSSTSLPPIDGGGGRRFEFYFKTTRDHVPGWNRPVDPHRAHATRTANSSLHTRCRSGTTVFACLRVFRPFKRSPSQHTRTTDGWVPKDRFVAIRLIVILAHRWRKWRLEDLLSHHPHILTFNILPHLFLTI